MTPSRIRLLFFIESLGCGGAEKSLVSLLGLLDYRHVEVTLLLVTDEDDLLPYLPKEVEIIRLQRHDNRLLSYIYSAKWRLMRALGIKRHGTETYWGMMKSIYPKLDGYYDVAIAYQQGVPTYYVATKVKARMKIAWVNTDMKAAGYRKKFNAPYYDRYNRVVVVSDMLAQRMAAERYFAPEKMVTIYDIVNVDVITRMSQQAVELPGPKVLRIVTVGRMAEAKNYPLAIEAAKILRDKGLRFRWTFVGDGPQMDEIKNMIAEKGLTDCINLAGLQTNPYPYIADADIYVQTSKFEGFGLTISEAKVLHKPIVSTNFPVVYNQLTDGVNGLIAEMTPQSVAEKIMLLHRDRTLAQKLIDATKQERNTTIDGLAQFYNLINSKKQ